MGGALAGLTFGTVTQTDRAATRASWELKDVVFSGVVLLGILGAYFYFTG